ncbi:hypothetical protein B0T19DRAFT_241880 [Cercophora scortea]|uniref:Uncharacterized protein n=1 Tax=Cercophora scortea TaxID=314031 RepID=A0AAE0I8N1_9PEZI|nr:hypothetical protein B0T19DRAFT_241880 [Cercophora scortea]
MGGKLKKMFGIKPKPIPTPVVNVPMQNSLDPTIKDYSSLYNSSTTTFATADPRTTFGQLNPIPEFPSQQQQQQQQQHRHHYQQQQQQQHTPPQQHQPMQQNPMALRPSPYPSPTGSRSVSDSTFTGFGSISNTSVATSVSTGPGNNQTHQRSFSAGNPPPGGPPPPNLKSPTTNTLLQQHPAPAAPQVTAGDVRRCTKLLRHMFELRLQMWALAYTHESDQHRRLEKKQQVDAILVDIHGMVAAWTAMPPDTWTEEEYDEVQWIMVTLADLPPY